MAWNMKAELYLTLQLYKKSTVKTNKAYKF